MPSLRKSPTWPALLRSVPYMFLSPRYATLSLTMKKAACMVSTTGMVRIVWR